MNVFIDSNILYQDYFFENSSNKKILKYSSEGLINLFMSEVVRLELRRQYMNELIEKNRLLEKALKDRDRLRFDLSIKNIEIDDMLVYFDRFYEQLDKTNDNFMLLDYSNDYLPDIIDRAIYRKKPFSEEKTELKDAIIWKTYSTYAESHDLQSCIFLTNNTSDFCSNQSKNIIHPDLLQDSARFQVINSAFNFVKTYGITFASTDYKFKLYLTNNITFTPEYVLSLIQRSFFKKIKKAIQNEIEHTSAWKVHTVEYFFDGALVGHDVELLECTDIEYEILSQTALVSGIIKAKCLVEILEYNMSKDFGEDSFSTVGEQFVPFAIYFNFDFEEGEKCSDFEITDIEHDKED